MAPRIVPTGGHAQDTAHGADGVDLLMSAHEFEDLDGFESASRANQVAAFERMSLSTRNCLISRRRRCSSWSSSVVKPPSPEPSSRSACCTQLRIDSGDGSNSLANYSGVRPARTNSTIWRRNSGAYGVCVLGRSSSLPKYRDVHHTGETPVRTTRLVYAWGSARYPTSCRGRTASSSGRRSHGPDAGQLRGISRGVLRLVRSARLFGR
jgi:hypothetical protein